ncbi:peptidoglycan-binding protein [Clostridioides sp. ZZV14-6045]|uniref:peptidoglycan-binding domain-containing protein n=1 Tax=Clostridioides sp. ZZV14-6045 TaxID=2811489 RepID=UPI001D11FA3E|nr:peptidoglycan-binding protein [Clostridioides sp. ZZV14-6045]
MFAKAKKILSITCCLLVLGGIPIFADSKQETSIRNQEQEEFFIEIEGYTFIYKDAPQVIKDQYNKTCSELGITPEPDAEIFIPKENMSKYSMYKSIARSDKFRIGFFDTFFSVTGAGKDYDVYVTTYVGYGHTQSGNPVHLAQLLLNRTGSSLTVDSSFGSATYNQVKSFQSRYGLQSDGIVGLGTWIKFKDVLRL